MFSCVHKHQWNAISRLLSGYNKLNYPPGLLGPYTEYIHVWELVGLQGDKGLECEVATILCTNKRNNKC